MPPKKGKKKKSKKIKMVGNETPDQVMCRLLRTYERNCAQSDTIPCSSLTRTLKDAKEELKLVTKFIVEAAKVEMLSDPVVALEPLVLALRQERYTLITELYVWELPLDHVQVATLALLFEKGVYPIKKLELMNNLIEAHSVRRLSLSFNCIPSLSTLVLDYNEFGDAGCVGLSDGLQNNKTLISVSLCFCDLGVASGSALGKVLDTTAVRELYLDGNDLECEGLIELIKGCAEFAEVEHQEAIEEAQRKKEEEERLALEEQEKRAVFTPASDRPSIESAPKGKKKKKKGKKKKSKEPPPPPPVGPWLYKLHIADNGIDYYGTDGHLAPMICMRLVRKLIAHSKCLEEIDLEDNLIGDMGGRELVEGLEERKEAEMGGVKMRTTNRVNADTFNQLVKLGVGLKKKKKKGKKKKKK